MSSPHYASNEATGDLGEHALGTWAAQVGYVLNGSTKDRTGWDGYLESPPEAAEDRRRGVGHQDVFPVRARIQVKTKQLLNEKGKRKKKLTKTIKKVTLRNWLRLVESPEPSFFLVVEYAGTTPEAAYLVHVGEDEIRAVLRRDRENEVDPKRKNTNEITRNVPYAKAPRIEPLNGAGLLAAIDAAVDTVGTDYVAWKRAIKMTAGFEHGVAIGHLTLSGGRPPTLHDIASVEVGLSEGLPFEKLRLHPFRFGLADPAPLRTISNNALSGPTPVATDGAEITVRAPTLGQSLTVQGDLFVSPTAVRIAQMTGSSDALSGVPVRVQSGRIRLVAPVDGEQLSMVFETPETGESLIPLRELRDMAAFMAVVRRALDSGTSIEFSVRTSQGAQFSTQSDTPTADGFGDDGFLPFADVVESAWRVARSFDLDESTETTTDEVQNQAIIIGTLDSAFRGRDLPLTFSFRLPQGSNEVGEKLHGKVVGYVCGLQLGDRRAFAVVQIGRADFDPEQSTLGISPTAPRVLYAEVGRVDDPLRDFGEVAHHAAQEAGEPVAVIEGERVAWVDPAATGKRQLPS